jgi:hypothetical protein
MKDAPQYPQSPMPESTLPHRLLAARCSAMARRRCLPVVRHFGMLARSLAREGIAAQRGTSERTVQRDWKKARTLL